MSDFQFPPNPWQYTAVPWPVLCVALIPLAIIIAMVAGMIYLS